jgi:hypothetical protein
MVISDGPAAKFCSECGERFGDSGAFCGSCGSKRFGGSPIGVSDLPFLDKSQVVEIVQLLEDADSDGTFTFGLTDFLFFEGYWLDGDIGTMSMNLTNPDQTDFGDRLAELGWEIFEPGDGFDFSYEQEFTCPDSDSRADALEQCLRALAITSSGLKKFTALTLDYQVNGEWKKIKYPVKK